MTAQQFVNIAPTLPQQPGIYKYFDATHTIIYVGKAKNLRKRISSYFTKGNHNRKTIELVENIVNIEFTIVHTEQDALLLENNLIKQHKPKYNISLKDDKTYPYIVIKNEPFPRVYFTRKKWNDGSEYLGPYTSVFYVREMLNFIKENIPLRTCKLNLSPKNIAAHKFKVCLEYHLGNCNGPCEAHQTQQQYNSSIQQIRDILKGNTTTVIHQFKNEMLQLAANLEYEKAAVIKHKIDHLENYQHKSVIVSKTLTNVDVFSIIKENDTAFINYLMVKNGTIIHTHTQELHTKLDETESEVLSFAIAQLRQTFNSTAIEIVVPFDVDYLNETIVHTIPKAGDKKKLLDLSLKNVDYFKEALRRKKILNVEQKTGEEIVNVLLELQQSLQLQHVPIHIECFDNSNFQGSFPVSACVCFKNGLPSKNDYRRFKIKSVTGINDFASMKETVYRQYKRYIDEQKTLPQLIIIDGGKGQLNAALESITELGLQGKLTLVGLAKNEEEIFFAGDKQSVKLDWNSEALKLIRRIRDEVHRFGITFHRSQRSKGAIHNELEFIKGIGGNTITMLLKKYKSVAKIKVQTFEELQQTIGRQKANIIVEYFKNKVEE